MTPEEIREKNEKIHRFMGHRVENGWCYLEDGFNGRFHSSNLRYNEWNELMPVLAKCNDVCKEMGYPDDLELPEWHVLSVACNIKLVYISVVDFIDWYNKQNSI